MSLRIDLNNTVLELNAPVHVPRGFLAASLPWEGVGVSDIKPANLSVLRDLQTALANEASFHLDGTALKKKTTELLNLTETLISRGEIEASRGPWFTVPTNNDFLYLGLIALAVGALTIFLYRKSMGHAVDPKTVEALCKILQARFEKK